MKGYNFGAKDMTRKLRRESKAFYGREVHVKRTISRMARKINLATIRSNERYNEYCGIR